MTPQIRSNIAAVIVLLALAIKMFVKVRNPHPMEESTTLTGFAALLVLAVLAIGYANAVYQMGAGSEDLAVLVPGFFAGVVLVMSICGCTIEAINRLARR